MMMMMMMYAQNEDIKLLSVCTGFYLGVCY